MARTRGRRIASRPDGPTRRLGDPRALSGVLVVGLLMVLGGLGAAKALDSADPSAARLQVVEPTPPDATTAPDEVAAVAVPQVLPGTAFRVDRAERRAMRAEVEAARLAELRKVSSFRVGTLNILGSNHARGGTSRAAREADLIRSRGIDLIGLQEVQRDQRGVFVSRLPGMTVWPQDAHGRQGYRLQIAYSNARFERVDGGYVTHNWIGMQVPIPWIELRDRESGARFFLVNAHNAPNDMQASRDVSIGIEAALVNRLKATGKPVLMVGDMNEKQSFFCKMAARTQIVSANGGSWSGGCRPPGGDVRIDWIVGAGDLTFSGYAQDGTTRATGMSDHYLIYADVDVVDSTEPEADDDQPAHAPDGEKS